MCNPRHELNNYGIRRLVRICEYIMYGGRGYFKLFGDRRWSMDLSDRDSPRDIRDRICACGVFEFIQHKYNMSWEILLASIMMDEDCLYAFCKLFGMIDCQGEVSLRRLTNKLSIVYAFPGDPPHPVSRKKINDIRLNALVKRNLLGNDPVTIARNVSSFDQVITDRVLRNIFWSCYIPGTGNFSISVSDLDQLDSLDDWCSICLEEFTNVFPGIKLYPCMHVFHPRCIQQLILNLGDNEMNCPTCRRRVSSLC